MKKALVSPRALGLTLLAFLFIALCIRASLWQFHRGVDRHAANTIITENIKKDPLGLPETAQLLTQSQNLALSQWRTITLRGTFDSRHEILLRNRYVDGTYGFGVLTLFHLDPHFFPSASSIWIDRGWVRAGKDAATPPVTTPVPSTIVNITGRLRTFDRAPQLRGSFFALPGGSSTLGQSAQLQRWNSEQAVETENYSLDLLSSSEATLTPRYPNELPELTDGPHMAYAVQWLVFAFLVLLGRILIFREDLRLS